MNVLYPEIEPYKTGRLKVSGVHEIYFEECGNPLGKPVVFIHGGPGGAIEPLHRQYFDPVKYRIILFDQRGCGKSTPYACLEENTTGHLIQDMEELRKQLNISRWMLFGGSWGSTLALAYAQAYPKAVSEMVLRGIFLLRKKEIGWFYQEGASLIFPDAWERYLEPIPEAERGDLITAYHKRLTSTDRATQLQAAIAWSIWEGSTSKLIPDPKFIDNFGADEFAVAFARLEVHYFINGGFLPEGQLIKDVPKIRHIPAVIIQGRYDMVCPINSAWTLHRAWPEAEFVIIPDAGHSAKEPGIMQALITATNKFATK